MVTESFAVGEGVEPPGAGITLLQPASNTPLAAKVAARRRRANRFMQSMVMPASRQEVSKSIGRTDASHALRAYFFFLLRSGTTVMGAVLRGVTGLGGDLSTFCFFGSLVLRC